ncbi:MAG: hypothetical protein Kow00108_08500 [Calditrichia bacterium]
MESILNFLQIFLPMAYFLTTFYYARFFFHEDPAAEKKLSWLLNGTLILHIIYIASWGLFYNHYPLASIFEVMTVIALFIALIYKYIETRLKIKTTGYFILIMAFILQLSSSVFIKKVDQIPEILNSPLFDFHSTFATLGYSALVISSIYSLMYILLYHDLKSNRFSIIFERLPSLESLAGMIYKSAVLGSVFLTLAIFLGHVFMKQTFNVWFKFDFKILSVYLVWLLYLLEIIGKKKFNWAPRIMAYLSIAGVVIIILSVVVVSYFIPSFHKFQ